MDTTNPYSALSMGTGTSEITPNLSTAMSNLSTSQNALTQAQTNSQTTNPDYPATQNAAGLGTPVQTVTQPSVQAAATTTGSGTMDSSSRSFNPWSLSGEAMSRQTPQ